MIGNALNGALEGELNFDDFAQVRPEARDGFMEMGGTLLSNAMKFGTRAGLCEMKKADGRIIAL